MNTQNPGFLARKLLAQIVCLTATGALRLDETMSNLESNVLRFDEQNQRILQAVKKVFPTGKERVSDPETKVLLALGPVSQEEVEDFTQGIADYFDANTGPNRSFQFMSKRGKEGGTLRWDSLCESDKKAWEAKFVAAAKVKAQKEKVARLAAEIIAKEEQEALLAEGSEDTDSSDDSPAD
jgi:hypothetical protein